MITELLRQYKNIKQNEFVSGNYKLVPIRDEDKYAIMQWRNEQIDVLRQAEPLTKEKQEIYFANVVDKLFEVNEPSQLLFSFLENEKLIGYGGLVHIDWKNGIAEVSFLTQTSRNVGQQFVSDWINYLLLLKQISRHLKLKKIFTYAYDLRPNLYDALLASGFIEEKRLKGGVEISGNKIDVLIHSCFLEELTFRMANVNDVLLYFNWANDEMVRKNSYEQKTITLNEHTQWFNRKIQEGICAFYLFVMNGEFAGQVRIDKGKEETIIGISIDKNFRGQNLSARMLNMACNDYLQKHKGAHIIAYIKESNTASLKGFEQAGFANKQQVEIHNEKSFKLTRSS